MPPIELRCCLGRAAAGARARRHGAHLGMGRQAASGKVAGRALLHRHPALRRRPCIACSATAGRLREFELLDTAAERHGQLACVERIDAHGSHTIASAVEQLERRAQCEGRRGLWRERAVYHAGLLILERPDAKWLAGTRWLIGFLGVAIRFTRQRWQGRSTDQGPRRREGRTDRLIRGEVGHRVQGETARSDSTGSLP